MTKLEQIVRLFAENASAEETLKAAKSKEEAIALLAQFGIEVTEEEFNSIGKQVLSDELPEEMLEFVAGGSWKGFMKGVRDFFKGFLEAF